MENFNFMVDFLTLTSLFEVEIPTKSNTRLYTIDVIKFLAAKLS